jgi:hypothetical protein
MDFEERYDAKASIFAVHWLVLIHFSFLLCWFQFGFLLETIFSLLNSSVVCFCVIGSSHNFSNDWFVTLEYCAILSV